MRLSWNTSNKLRRCVGLAAIQAAVPALIFFCCLSVRAQQSSLEGQPVAEIRILDESGKEIAPHLRSFPLHVGEPLDIAKERDTLRELYRNGDFADVQVKAVPTSQGIRLDFLVRRNYFNNAIRIIGLKEPPSEPAALAALRLGLGEPFRQSALLEAIDRLKDTLRNEGLFQAKVRRQVSHDGAKAGKASILPYAGEHGIPEQ